jgi:hypothetical protein
MFPHRSGPMESEGKRRDWSKIIVILYSNLYYCTIFVRKFTSLMKIERGTKDCEETEAGYLAMRLLYFDCRTTRLQHRWRSLACFGPQSHVWSGLRMIPMEIEGRPIISDLSIFPTVLYSDKYVWFPWQNLQTLMNFMKTELRGM